MGYVPLPPMPANAAQALAQSERRLLKEMAGRHSRWAWKRRRAYRACVTLIRMREAINGLTDDPWVLRLPKQADARRTVRA